MWVASPSATHPYDVMDVYYLGHVGNIDYNYGSIGFRPLVSLKSDSQLQKNADGTYTIL